MSIDCDLKIHIYRQRQIGSNKYDDSYESNYDKLFNIKMCTLTPMSSPVLSVVH
jgi:hypothetical protein